MFGLIQLQRFIPELKLRLFRFKKKHTFCTDEHIIRFGITLDAQIGVLTEKSRYLISMEMVLLSRDRMKYTQKHDVSSL